RDEGPERRPFPRRGSDKDPPGFVGRGGPAPKKKPLSSSFGGEGVQCLRGKVERSKETPTLSRRFRGDERCQGRAAYHRVDGTGVRKPAKKVLDGLSLFGKTHQEKTKEPLRRQIPEIRLSVLSVREKTLRHGPCIEGGPELVGQVPKGARA